MSVTIRRARKTDVDDIERIYNSARNYMRREGNLTQWVHGYPTRQHILNDLSRGHLYVGETSNRVVMAFAFILGDDPTYSEIKGEWLNKEPYGTIHRIGSDGSEGGMLKGCLDFCFGKVKNIRIDTHADNVTMLRLLREAGFVYCGEIICQDGTPRLAFQAVRG